VHWTTSDWYACSIKSLQWTPNNQSAESTTNEWISEESDDFANSTAVFTLSAGTASAAAKQNQNRNKLRIARLLGYSSSLPITRRRLPALACLGLASSWLSFTVALFTSPAQRLPQPTKRNLDWLANRPQRKQCLAYRSSHWNVSF